MKALITTLALLLSAPQAIAADLGVMPVAVHLGGSVTRGTVNITNQGREAVTMQAETIAWTRTDSVDEDRPTTELMVNPAIFTVEPGQTQVVRVGLRRASANADETTYRLVLREVPTESTAAAGANGIRVLMAMRLPVYVAPNEVVHKEEWAASQDSQGNIVARLRNTGNVHYKVGKVLVRSKDAKEGAPAAAATLGAVLFPGENRDIAFRAQQPIVGREVMLEVFTDRGVQYVPLTLAQN